MKLTLANNAVSLFCIVCILVIKIIVDIYWFYIWVTFLFKCVVLFRLPNLWVTLFLVGVLCPLITQDWANRPCRPNRWSNRCFSRQALNQKLIWKDRYIFYTTWTACTLKLMNIWFFLIELCAYDWTQFLFEEVSFQVNYFTMRLDLGKIRWLCRKMLLRNFGSANFVWCSLSEIWNTIWSCLIDIWFLCCRCIY